MYYPAFYISCHINFFTLNALQAFTVKISFYNALVIWCYRGSGPVNKGTTTTYCCIMHNKRFISGIFKSPTQVHYLTLLDLTYYLVRLFYNLRFPRRRVSGRCDCYFSDNEYSNVVAGPCVG